MYGAAQRLSLPALMPFYCVEREEVYKTDLPFGSFQRVVSECIHVEGAFWRCTVRVGDEIADGCFRLGLAPAAWKKKKTPLLSYGRTPLHQQANTTLASSITVFWNLSVQLPSNVRCTPRLVANQ